MSETKLTQKQKKLIDLYIECGNISKAAKEAGYSSRQAAHYFLTNNDIAKNEIAHHIRENLKTNRNRRYEVLKQASCISEKLYCDGDLKGAIKALEFEAKLLNMYTESSYVETRNEKKDEEIYDFSKLTVEELKVLQDLTKKMRR